VLLQLPAGRARLHPPLLLQVLLQRLLSALPDLGAAGGRGPLRTTSTRSTRPHSWADACVAAAIRSPGSGYRSCAEHAAESTASRTCGDIGTAAAPLLLELPLRTDAWLLRTRLLRRELLPAVPLGSVTDVTCSVHGGHLFLHARINHQALSGRPDRAGCEPCTIASCSCPLTCTAVSNPAGGSGTIGARQLRQWVSSMIR
jgi:hypothetical protein